MTTGSGAGVVSTGATDVADTLELEVDGGGSEVVGGVEALGVVDSDDVEVGAVDGEAVGEDSVGVLAGSPVDGVDAVGEAVGVAGLVGAGVDVVSTGVIAAGSLVVGDGANSR